MTTPNLGLSFMATSSLSKEAIFNEAIIAFDALLGGIVLGIQNSPPGAPADGDSYIIGTAGTGAWAGYNNQIVFYFNGWRFIEPVTKMRLFSNAQDAYYQFNGTTWVTIPTPAVAELNDLDDVDLDTVTDGDILVYNSGTGKWENTASSLTISDIGDLGDVDMSTPPTAGQALVWDDGDSMWKPATLSFSVEMSTLTDVNVDGRADGQILVWDDSEGEYVHQDPSFATYVNQLTDIGDVVSATPDVGETIIWNGAAWEPGGVPASLDGSTDIEDGFAGHANQILRLDPTELEFLWIDHTLAALLDTTITSIADNQFLRYDSGTSKWVNESVTIPAALNDLTNVSGSPSTGQVLTWNGSGWVPSGIPTQLADWKDSVRVAVGTNVDISTALENGDSAGGVTLATGNRVLLYGQSTGSQNGIYVVPASGAASRATDADANAEVTTGLAVYVEEGTDAGEIFILTTTGSIVVGTTSLTFAPLSPGGADALDDLSDVTITSALDGHILIYDTGEWVNRLPVLEDISDVDLTTPPTAGQVLTWDNGSSTWVPGDIGIAELGDIGDVDLVSAAPTDGQALVWSTGDSKWVPGSPAASYPDFTGNEAKVLAVNATADGVEWVAQSGGGATALTINDQTDNYTLVLSDGTDTYVRVTKATAVSLTVPPNSSVAFDVGTTIPIRSAGVGQLTVVEGSGVTVNTSETLLLRSQHSSAMLIKVGTDEWDLTGDLETA